jgi:hypothetical protein
MSEKIFTQGLFFNLPHAKAPEYVKGKLSIKADEFIEFLNANKNEKGWVTIDLKVGQSGKAYGELNTWTPEQQQAPTQKVETKQNINAYDTVEYPEEEIDLSQIPF